MLCTLRESCVRCGTLRGWDRPVVDGGRINSGATRPAATQVDLKGHKNTSPETRENVSPASRRYSEFADLALLEARAPFAEKGKQDG